MKKQITFDGYDGPDLVCPFINIWKDLDDRGEGIAAVVSHDDIGDLRWQQGEKCKVVTKDGTEGYVTFFFIRELKAEWQEQQEENTQGGYIPDAMDAYLSMVLSRNLVGEEP